MRAAGRRGIRALAAGVLVAAAALGLGGCAPAEPAPAPIAVAIPDTPVGSRAGWILDVLNAEEDTEPAQWEPLLHPDFLAEVPAEQLVQLLNSQIRPARPFVATAYDGTEREAVARVEGRIGDPFELVLVLSADDLIQGMLLRPAAPPREPAVTVGEVSDRLAALPATVSALVERDGESLIALEPDRLAPLASVFKLYVLLAVAEAVDAGTLSWDETLVVTDTLRSLPSGRLQDESAGTEVAVSEAARLMIEISDNTATDLLIDRLGREAVEAAVAAAGHSDPAVLRPFPTTRELFQLELGDPERVRDWADADEDGRRAILAELAGEPLPSLDGVEAIPANWQSGVEWFASAQDIAAAHALLAAASGRHPEVAAALTANPGVAVPAGWEAVAFKGGSSPGVLTGSWRATAADGSTLTIVLLASGDDPVAVEGVAVELFGLAADLLAFTSP